MLRKLRNQSPERLFCHQYRVRKNGAEFSAEVKKDSRFAHIPIVAQTADVETNGNFDMSHFDAVILKPLTREKLSDMVKRVEDGDLQKGNGGTPINLG